MKHWLLLLLLLPAGYALDGYETPRSGFSADSSVRVLDTAVYNTGYLSENGTDWTAFSLVGEERGNWIVGEATSNTDLSSARYVAIFSCNWSSGWSCGSTWQVRDRGEQSSSDSNYTSTDSLEGDYQALQDFYYAMDGPNWDVNTGWEDMTPETMGNAFGVFVYPDDHEYAGRVKELGLSGDPNTDSTQIIGNGLQGDHIPDSFANLKKMTHVRLKGNNITARLDNWMTGLDSIVKLSLANSRDITGQTDFDYRDTSQYNHPGKTNSAYNLWSGGLPDNLSMLTKLEFIELQNAKITGSLPTHLPDSMRGLIIGNNQLVSTLPAWPNLVNLTHLYIGNRYDQEGSIYGPVPIEWNNWVSIEWLLMNQNDLSGEFPEMDNWKKLRHFLMGGNEFTGTDPTHWLFDSPDQSVRFAEFSMGGNAWTSAPISSESYKFEDQIMYVISNYDNEPDQPGIIPKWIADLNTRQLLWSKNAFTGYEEGSYIPARNKLYWFDRNQISGELPPIQTPWDSPQFRLQMWSNNFSGNIPDWSGATSVATTDVYVLLHDNQLEGIIPAYFADFDPEAFGSFTVHNNKFTPKDILPHRESIEQAANTYQFIPQKPFGNAETVTVGETIDRSSYAYTGNEYRWLKDDNALTDETQPTIDTSGYGTGEYVLQIVHPEIEYTFESEPVTVIS